MKSPGKKYLIITVIGSHAGEEVGSIFSRKQRELKENGKTYWLLKSFRAKTAQIQQVCQKAREEGEEVGCLFVEASSRGGARPTVHGLRARQISSDGSAWDELSGGVRITGKLDAQSTALVLDELSLADPQETVNLWQYSEYGTGQPVRLQLGASTVCCVQAASVGMKSRFRRVVATGTLALPYAVFVR